MESVKVAVRVRPLNSNERAAHDPSIVSVSRNQIVVDKHNGETKAFAFDFAYPPLVAQRTVFDDVAKPIVDSVINGYNGTIFAYGQTGTGKTFTMEGVVDDAALRGIMPQTFEHIFGEIARASSHVEYLVRVSFLEIYNDDVYDLLRKEKRAPSTVKEGKGGFFVKDLTTYTVNNVDDTMKVLRVGQKGRQIGATKMNEGSSRSHSVFAITVESCEKDADGNARYRVGKLNMVDLAGSERQKKTEASGDRLNEAKNINLSLSALGNVINALVNPRSGHIPFRDSKLTKLLQDSLGGNTKTVMIAAIGPAESNLDETLSTLRYANRAKDIKNKPTINEDPKDAMLRQYQEEIEQLKRQLEQKKQGGGGGGGGVHEEIIEQVVVKHVGLSEEEASALEREAKAQLESFMAMHEEEKKVILANKTDAEQAAILYEMELARNREQLSKEQSEIAALESQLKAKEMSLMSGGQEIAAATAQEHRLAQTEEELRVQLENQRKLEASLDEAEEAELYMNEQYSSRQEELEKKSKKLRKLFGKYKEKCEDLKDIQDEYEVEREDLLDTIRHLTQQLRLKSTMLQRLVSKDMIALVERHAQWDAYNENWRIAGIDLAGNARHDAAPGPAQHRGLHRRLSTYERIAALVDKDRQLGGHLFARRPSEGAVDLKKALASLRSPEGQHDGGGVYMSYELDACVKSKQAKRAKRRTTRRRSSGGNSSTT